MLLKFGHKVVPNKLAKYNKTSFWKLSYVSNSVRVWVTLYSFLLASSKNNRSQWFRKLDKHVCVCVQQYASVCVCLCVCVVLCTCDLMCKTDSLFSEGQKEKESQRKGKLPDIFRKFSSSLCQHRHHPRETPGQTQPFCCFFCFGKHPDILKWVKGLKEVRKEGNVFQSLEMESDKQSVGVFMRSSYL